MLTIGRQTPTSAVGADAWARLLDSEERHVGAQGFGAAVLVVNYAGELLRHDGGFDPDSGMQCALVQSGLYPSASGDSVSSHGGRA